MGSLARQAPIRQQVRKTTLVAHSTTGVGLTGQREGRASRQTDLAGDQVQVVHQVVGPDPLRALVQTHAPHRHRRLALGAEPTGRFDDIGLGAVGNSFCFFRSVRLEEFDVIIPILVYSLDLAKTQLSLDEINIDHILFDQYVSHGVENRKIGSRLELQMQVGDA